MTDVPPTADEYAAWQDNPVTRFVMAGVRAVADGQQASWAARAWAGDLDPLGLERHRTRAICYRELAELTFEQALGANGVESA